MSETRKRKKRKLARTDGYAAIYLQDPLHIISWTVCATAEQVRLKLGFNYYRDDHKHGWEIARKAGARVRKITIREVRP